MFRLSLTGYCRPQISFQSPQCAERSFTFCRGIKLATYIRCPATYVPLKRIHGCILLMPELHCWVGDLDLRFATCAANGKVPHQKPGVMVGHLHSTEKRLAQGSLLKNLTKLEVGTGGKTSQHRYWGQSMCPSQKQDDLTEELRTLFHSNPSVFLL